MDFADIYLLVVVSLGLLLSYKIMKSEERQEKNEKR